MGRMDGDFEGLNWRMTQVGGGGQTGSRKFASGLNLSAKTTVSQLHVWPILEASALTHCVAQSKCEVN